MSYFYHCPYVGIALINILRPKKKKKEKIVYVVCVTVYVDLISLTRAPWTRHGVEICTWHEPREEDNLKRKKKNVFFF
jgi:hypothetical protein